MHTIINDKKNTIINEVEEAAIGLTTINYTTQPRHDENKLPMN